MKQFGILTFIASFLLSTQLAFASEQNFNIAIIQEWSSFNQVTSQLASNEAIFPFILRRMIKRTPDGSVLADVAEQIPTLKKNTATWVIKKNAKWADGHTVTCADWHLGWQVGLNPKVSVDIKSNYQKITKIEWNEKAPQSCSVTYASIDWTYDRDLPPLLPSHIEKSIYENFKNEPEGYDRNTSYISTPTNKALYNGPYYVSEFKLGSHVILIRNEHFYGAKPKIQKIIIKHISDTSALKANLMAGQINGISAVGFPPDTALLFDDEFKKTNSKLKVQFQNSSIFQGVYFNLENEILKDIKVREALSRSINKSDIVKAFFNNNLLAAESVLAPQHPAYQPRSSIYSKDKAIKLLTEAGWKLGANGIREKNGKQLNFIFKTSAGLKVLESIQVYICDQFKSIGAHCTIKNESPRILLGQSVPRGEFDLAMYGQPIPADSSITSYYSSKEIPTAKNSWSGGNSIRLNSPELDQLLIDFDKEALRPKRNTIIKKIDHYLQSHYAMIPLYHRREAVVIPKNLVGLMDSYEGTAFIDPENWSFN